MCYWMVIFLSEILILLLNLYCGVVNRSSCCWMHWKMKVLLMNERCRIDTHKETDMQVQIGSLHAKRQTCRKFLQPWKMDENLESEIITQKILGSLFCWNVEAPGWQQPLLVD